MAAITVRKIPEDIHRALKARAKRNARSAEAEARAILAEAVTPEMKGVGTLLREFAQKFGGVELEVERDKSPLEPADFS